jgi:hypothetical protein
MNLPDHIRPGFNQNLGAVFMAEIVLLKVQVVGVDAGAHGAVEEDDPLADKIEKRRSHG